MVVAFTLNLVGMKKGIVVCQIENHLSTNSRKF